MIDLSPIPIIDHHAHPLQKPEATQNASAFRRWFSESTEPQVHERDVPTSLFFRTSLRWLAERLGCKPTLAAVLEARSAIPYESWIVQLISEANISRMFCDYGYGGPQAYTHQDMQRLLPCPVEPILRLETLAEELIVHCDRFDQLLDGYLDFIARVRDDGYVALKSVIAYRTGLAIEPATLGEAADGFVALREEALRHGRVRLDHKSLADYLLRQALGIAQEQRLPVQFHTGFGDKEADLRWANPVHLRSIFEEFEAPLVLLHAGWPFYREAAHLAAIYPHVWLDLSLAVPFATAGIPAMLRDILGMAPHSKILFATDAFTMPELFWLAARWGRWGLGLVLGEFVAEGFLNQGEAYSAAEAILGQNAERLYR